MHCILSLPRAIASRVACGWSHSCCSQRLDGSDTRLQGGDGSKDLDPCQGDEPAHLTVRRVILRFWSKIVMLLLRRRTPTLAFIDPTRHTPCHFDVISFMQSVSRIECFARLQSSFRLALQQRPHHRLFSDAGAGVKDVIQVVWGQAHRGESGPPTPGMLSK